MNTLAVDAGVARCTRAGVHVDAFNTHCSVATRRAGTLQNILYNAKLTEEYKSQSLFNVIEENYFTISHNIQK